MSRKRSIETAVVFGLIGGFGTLVLATFITGIAKAKTGVAIPIDWQTNLTPALIVGAMSAVLGWYCTESNQPKATLSTPTTDDRAALAITASVFILAAGILAGWLVGLLAQAVFPTYLPGAPKVLPIVGLVLAVLVATQVLWHLWPEGRWPRR